MPALKVLRKRLKLLLDASLCMLIPRKGGHRAAVVKVDAIGDFVIWKPYGERLLEYLKGNGEVVLIANHVWIPLARQAFPDVEIFPVHPERFRKSWCYRIAVMLALRMKGFREVYHPTYSREFSVGDRVVLACGAPRSVGFDGDPANYEGWQKDLSGRWYTELIRSAPGVVHERLRHGEFLAALGLPCAPRPQTPRKPSEQYFVVAPGASWAGKAWPLANFAAILMRLFEGENDARCIVLGSAEEAPLGETLAETFPGRVENRCGKTSLPEFTRIIEAARFVLCNDSSSAHVAAHCGVPVVVIAGGWHFGRFLPYPKEESQPPLYAAYRKMECFNCNWNCVYGKSVPVFCIATVEVDDVWALVEKVLMREERD